MSLEIRQLIVNAQVAHPDQDTDTGRENGFDPEAFRSELLDACHDMIRQMREREKER